VPVPRVRRSRSPRIAAGCGLVVAVLAIGSAASALDRTWTTDADFNAGTSSSTTVSGDSVRLSTDGVGRPDPAIAWWNASWGQRACVDINNSGASLTDHQISLTIDTATPVGGGRMDAAGDDLRFISSDGATELDYWIEGPINDAATVVWVQVDTVPAGASTICLYYDNTAAAAQSDPFAPFTYSTAQELYVAVSETQAGQPIAVTSYIDNNTISDGITSVTLNTGGTHTFPGAGHTASTVVSATGPIAIQGTGNNGDTYVPIAFAGTSFVVASQRNNNRLSFHAPFGAATVVVQHSGTTTNVAVPAGTSVSTAAQINTGDAAVITSDQPVLVTHQASGSYDALVAVPATTDPLYGIRSTQHITGFGSAGTSVAVTESSGASTTISGGFGQSVARTGGGGLGTGPAVIATTTAGGPIGAIQQADNDGVESTSYWPLREMNVVYRTPVQIDYIAFACPEQNTNNVRSDGVTLSCTGTGGAGFPGKALDNGGAAAGALFESLDGRPFFVYQEDDAHNDENNVLGPKQARLTSPTPPTAIVGPEESRYVGSGTWTSDPNDTGCGARFGGLSWNPAAQPAGTDLRFQVATSTSPAGPFTFLGPDGSAGTFYTNPAGTALPTVHDLDRFVQLRASLSTTDTLLTPVLDDVTVSWDGVVTISGKLFNDVAGNGSNDPSDPGIPGIDVELWLDDGNSVFEPANDTLITSVPSAGDGTYTFADQLPGTYFVRADETQLPPGFVVPGTTPNPAGPLTIADCGSAVADIGWQLTEAVVVTVFSDVDGSGSFGGSDVGLAGIDVELWVDDGDGVFDPGDDSRIATATTMSSGAATFGGVAVGSYFALVDDTETPPGHDPIATTPNPTGLLTVTIGSGDSAAIGFEPFGAISGVAFADENRDGVRQPGEDPVVGVVVGIYLDDGDGTFDPGRDVVAAAPVTDASGAYGAMALAPGTYWVAPFDPPAPSLPVAPIATVVAAGQTTTEDIPFAQSASISGVVVFASGGVVDPNGPPVQGMPITVYRDDGDGSFDRTSDPVAGTAVTNIAGEFTVPDLAPGQYFVELSGPSLLFNAGARVVGPNPVGPVPAGTTDVVFGIDSGSITLPETGATTRGPALQIGSALLLVGLTLALVGRRRRPMYAAA